MNNVANFGTYSVNKEMKSYFNTNFGYKYVRKGVFALILLVDRQEVNR